MRFLEPNIIICTLSISRGYGCTRFVCVCSRITFDWRRAVGNVVHSSWFADRVSPIMKTAAPVHTEMTSKVICRSASAVLICNAGRPGASDPRRIVPAAVITIVARDRGAAIAIALRKRVRYDKNSFCLF